MNQSSLLKSFAWRTFFQALFFQTLLFAVVAAFYWLSRDVGTPLNPMDYAAMFVFLIGFGLLQWLFQKNTLTKLCLGQPSPPTAKTVKPTAPTITGADRETRRNRDKRLFVHLFSVLQREGRLMDFLQEDLACFEDDQIGAAVRNIHENCKKTVAHYLSPEPVMRQAQGETVEIAEGFDRHAVKLVGNVVGNPPFTGVLRHRGWQLGSISLPKLSDKENPNLIAPAEVEIR